MYESIAAISQTQQLSVGRWMEKMDKYQAGPVKVVMVSCLIIISMVNYL